MKRVQGSIKTSPWVTIVFRSFDKQARIPFGSLLSAAAGEAGIPMDSSCGGRGKCGKCRARLIRGRVSEATEAEKRVFSSSEIGEKHILLCQRKALGDCVLETDLEAGLGECPAPSKGPLLDTTLEVDPSLRKTYREFAPPTRLDQGADLERILQALGTPTRVDPDLLLRLPQTLRQADWRVTLVRHHDELIGVEAGDTAGEIYGLAFDIGTTTVAGYLVDLVGGRVVGAASATNKQALHGADVVSRMTYAMTGREGLAEMQTLAVRTLEGIIRELLARYRVTQERIYSLAFTGNTVMNHFLLGISPENIALAPFVPVFTRSLMGTVERLGIKGVSPDARFVVLPNIAGYVGADTVSVMVATRIHERLGHWLAIDIGTNGEIVLSSRGRLLTCSTAAGPAFEGGCISQGMAAVLGAVSGVEFSQDVRLSVVGAGRPRGVCGSGLVDAVSEMLRVGILHRSGRILPPEECPRELLSALKARVEVTESGLRFVLARGRRDVAVTQKDIRELQLAKGAIRAGIEILLKEADLRASQLDGILLAGAFGSNLRPESLQAIGLIPPVPRERIRPVGNAAATGAIMALLSRRQLELASQLAGRSEHIELSLRKDFQKAFLAALDFGSR
ncbi:MAG: ASKHA domain-containing protein [Thermodesulfobacteriota bacterium]